MHINTIYVSQLKVMINYYCFKYPMASQIQKKGNKKVSANKMVKKKLPWEAKNCLFQKNERLKYDILKTKN